LCDTVEGFKAIKLDLDYPISDGEILRLTEASLSKDEHIKLVLMDAITSLPGVRFPWEKVCSLCRKYKKYSLVDAAHAITQIPIDIKDSQPDFFVSNLHKWSYVPRACAVLYARNDMQKLLHSVPIGHGYISTTQPMVSSPISTNPEGQWVTEHEWTGTQDWSGYLSVSAAFKFIEKCGGAEKIREYCHQLAIEGGEAAAMLLGTEILKVDGSELTANMVNVRLPLDVPDENSKTHIEELAAQREAMFERLFERDCFPYPFVMSRRGRKEWWCRYSAQIYLDLDDFEKGTVALREICEELRKIDWAQIIRKQDEETVVQEMEMALDPEARIS
jgi:hercynylcysteine S-oxide lyase